MSKSEYDEADTCWHIMTVARSGAVSLMQNLNAETARLAYQKLRPDRAPVNYIGLPDTNDTDFSGGFSWCTSGGGVTFVSDHEIIKVEVLGPKGAELDPWRGVSPRIVDLSAEVARQREEIRAMKLAADLERSPLTK